MGSSTPILSPDQSCPVVNLHVAAKNLPDVDLVTVSDPVCVLFIWNKKWIEFARTEVIWNNLNPEWVKFFAVMYIFQIKQPLKFQIYSIHQNSANLSAQTLIGECETEVAEIVRSNFLELPLNFKSSSKGTLRIISEQVENSASMVNFEIKSSNIKKGFFMSSGPFILISKISESGNFIPIHQTEVDKNKKWKPFQIPFQLLCNLDPVRPLRFSLFWAKSHSASKLHGYSDTSFQQLHQGSLKLNGKGGNLLIRMDLKERYSFYDFVSRGLELNLIVAIDFTASNRAPSSPKSLHYVDPSGDSRNQYETCIIEIGQILCPYDTDQLFPVFGFGAKLGPNISHCFPLTFDSRNICVHGLDGILGCYKHALSQVALSGPTLFSHVIRKASQIAVDSPNNYQILLILTDGLINDMQDTIDAICDAGRIPLSIIIVGVGLADFENMDILDGDDVPLVSRSGHQVARDLVQFVPFEKFKNVHSSILAAQVLEEVPRQVIEWAELNHIKPHGM